MLALLIALNSALAADPGDYSAGPRLVLRGNFENLEDPAIVTYYGSGARMGSLGLVLPIWHRLSIDVEAGYARLPAKTASEALSMRLVPLSAPLQWNFGDPDGVSPYVGVGPSFTTFSETHPRDEQGYAVTSGARLGAEARLGLRADLGLVEPPMPPAKAGPVKGVELEVYIGRRFALPSGDDSTGLSFGAWRGSVGLGFKL